MEKMEKMENVEKMEKVETTENTPLQSKTPDIDTNIVDTIINHVDQSEEVNNISSQSLIVIVILLMKEIESFSELKGTEKKEYIIVILKKIIDKKVSDDQTKLYLNSITETTLPLMIDTIVKLDKNQIKIKTKKWLKRIKRCFNSTCKQ